ncbi:MAG: ribonuclease R [Lachnospiraceae bacterium]|nr:ribonuclease R [Lachnospiraceae bacterium]
MKKEKTETNLTDKRKKVICDLVEDSLYVPMKEKELAIFLQVEAKDREELKRILAELVGEGKLECTSKGKYIKGTGKKTVLPAKTGNDRLPVTGTYISHPKGFGFVEIEGQEEDLFVPEGMSGNAFHKDLVEVELLLVSGGKRREAKVVKILERGFTRVVGTFEKSKNFGFVVPDNERFGADIFVPLERSKGAVDGHKVVVELTDYGSSAANGRGKSPEGKVVEIIGHINDPGVDILSIVRGFDLPMEFSEKVLNQAHRVSSPVSEADMAGRMDLRHVQMVTIDGEDAKDLDDAVSVSKEDGIYHLGVHIADVTNYVQENSALDKEAVKRGTSVYLVDRVIPMLPHILSNGICSLNQGEDRLALSCLMDIDEKGKIVNYEIAETVICVDRRMSYTSVKKILEDKDPEECSRYENLVPMFQLMEELALILRKKRRSRGAIDFDFPESKIILDAQGHPTEIKAYERNTATKIIEDFMLVANETVAQHFYWLELPFVYRTHDTPDPEKIQKLSAFINNLGYYIKTVGQARGSILAGKGGKKNTAGAGEIHPKEIQKLLDKIEGTPEEAMISRLTLRSMKQAKYTTESTGHFGLACDFYCHFTSPIRRYPDLQIHRIIKEQLRGRLKEDRIAHYRGILTEVAKHSSEMERRADEAERETEKLKKVEYMEDHLYEEFEGVVSGVTSWGIYVELPSTVEGLVHVSKLPGDYYYYREETYEMVGELTGKTYSLGQVIKVRAVGTDRAARTIDLEIVEGEEENG